MNAATALTAIHRQSVPCNTYALIISCLLRLVARSPGSCGSTGLCVRIRVGHRQLPLGEVDADDGAVPDVAAEQGAPDPGLDLAGDEPAQRAGPVDGVVALLGDVAAGGLRHLEGHAPVRQAGPEVAEQQVDDVLDLRQGQSLE